MPAFDQETIQNIIDGADSKADAINELFDLGLSKGQLIKLGFKEATVRKEVNRRKVKGKEVPGTPTHEPSMIPATLKQTESLLPEFMVKDIEEYFNGSVEQRRIFSAGMMVPLMGVRLFAEMVKPLTSLINAMKGDQVEATMKAMALGQQQAQDAAIQASQLTANQIMAGQKEAAVASSANPLQAQMAQTMAPLFGNLMNFMMSKFMPGMSGQGEGTPKGWTRKQGKPQKEKK